jgi:hypothetical protein
VNEDVANTKWVPDERLAPLVFKYLKLVLDDSLL